MELTTIRELFKNRDEYLDKKVTVGGWVRSLRDSKTFGFIVVNDGSYFQPLQVVYHDKMENFAEVSKLNVGAAIIVTGTLVATPQAKQPFEISPDRGSFRTGLSAAEETPQFRVSEDDFSSAPENEYISGGIPCSFPGGICDPQVLPGERICICPHSADHRQ